MMSKAVLVSALAALSSASDMGTLSDSAALIQAHVEQSQQRQLPSPQKMAEQMAKSVYANPVMSGKEIRGHLFGLAKEVSKGAVKKAIEDKTPFGVGKLLVNGKDKSQVKACSDISSSLFCATSKKVYGIACAGWGGSSCLALGASCKEITLPGVCKSSVQRLNISCLGWGGRNCLPMGAKADLITEERLCLQSEAMLGIRSMGWSGRKCLDQETATCDQLVKPGICNDAGARLGMNCAGWGGSSCLPAKGATCKQISTRHICEQASTRFNMSCAWGLGGQCKEASI